MSLRTVIAQRADGRRWEQTVDADTDEQACAKALALLNSWRAVCVVEVAQLAESEKHPVRESVGTARAPDASRVPAEPGPRIVKHDTIGGYPGGKVENLPKPKGPRIVKHGDVTDWIELHWGDVGAVGEALREATRADHGG